MGMGWFSSSLTGLRVENLLWRRMSVGTLLEKSSYLSDSGEFKGGYLDFSHLTEFKNINITEIYMKKQYKSPVTKNNKIRKKKY